MAPTNGGIRGLDCLLLRHPHGGRREQAPRLRRHVRPAVHERGGPRRSRISFQEGGRMTTPDTTASGLAPGYLVAAPGLRDPTFARSLVLMVEHSPDGSLGFIVNRPSPVTAGGRERGGEGGGGEVRGRR